MGFKIEHSFFNDYLSPVIVGFKDVITEDLVNSIDDMVYQVITGKFEIKIDKPALIRALNYDRTSFKEGEKKGYKKGYQDGVDSMKCHSLWAKYDDHYACIKCGFDSPENYHYCPHCGSAMSDELL